VGLSRNILKRMATVTGSNTESEWISISKKKSFGKGSSAKTAKLLAKGHAALSTSSHEAAESVETVAMAIRAGMLSVKDSKYYQFLASRISESVGACFDNVIAFGLGNLTSETSKLQLVLYLCLCDSLLATGISTTSKSIYDPCISGFDRSVLEVLQIPVLSENTKGKHAIGGSGTTLFYLPHCPYRLYCNILWANWDHLDHLYLLGNRCVSMFFSTLWFDNSNTASLWQLPILQRETNEHHSWTGATTQDGRYMLKEECEESEE